MGENKPLKRLGMKGVGHGRCRREGTGTAGAVHRLPAAGNAVNQFKMATQGEHVVGLFLLWRLLFVLPFLVIFSNLKNKMSLMKTDVLLPCLWKKN